MHPSALFANSFVFHLEVFTQLSILNRFEIRGRGVASLSWSHNPCAYLQFSTSIS